MDIEFENAKARQIYKQTLNAASPAAKEKVKNLFVLAGQSDFSAEISGKEAKAAEEVLKQHDTCIFYQLGVVYTPDEVDLAIEEFNEWKAAQGDEQDNRLADAIKKYVIITEKYPGSVHAAEALRQLAILYYITGQEEKSALCAEQWLKIAPYEPFGFIANYQSARYEVEFLSSFPHTLIEKAQYALYEKGDIKKAERLLGNVQGIALEREEVKLFAAEIALRKAGSLSQALSIYDRYRSDGTIGAYFERLIFGGKKRIVGDIPENLYFLALLLNCRPEVKEVRLFSFLKFEAVDGETKTPRNCYFIMYKAANRWHLVSESGACAPEEIGLGVPQLSEIAEANTPLTVNGATVTQEIFTNKLFAKSWEESQDSSRINAQGTIERLELSRLSAEKQKMLTAVSAQFSPGHQEKPLAGITRAYMLLPSFFFNGLREVDLRRNPDFAGSYLKSDKKIALACAEPYNYACEEDGTFAHELGHHVSYLLEALRLGFYRISWFRPDDPCGVIFGYMIINDECATQPPKWQKRPGTKLTDFAWEYGAESPSEDFAVSFATYYQQNFLFNRESIRKSMQKGDFVPAIKYLYQKYLIYFDPADGLCYEYKVSEDDLPLTLAEVKKNMADWGKSTGKTVPEHLKTILTEIEETYKSNLAMANEWVW